MRFVTQLTSEENAQLTELIANRLGIGLEYVSSGFTVEFYSSASPVVISWAGRASVPAAEFEELLALAREFEDRVDDLIPDGEGGGA